MLRVKNPDIKKQCCLVCMLLVLIFFTVSYALPFNTIHRRLSKSSLVHNRINPNLIINEALDKRHVKGDVLNKVTAHQPVEKKVINEKQNPDEIIAEQTDKKKGKKGYGIVYTGNVDLFPLIYVSISFLNYMSFTYPVEIFINGVNYEEDMEKCKRVFLNEFESRFNIKCLYIDNNKENWSKYGYKLIALMRTSFRHTLFLDDDNIIIQSPSILFQSEEYKVYHAIFWTDFWGKHCKDLFQGGYILYAACFPENGVYDYLNKEYIKYDTNNLKYTQSQEAAQLVIDTFLYYDTLDAVLKCTESGNYQRYLHGDKDCFRFMFLERNDAFYYTPIMPQYIGFTKVDNKGDTYFYRHALLQFWENKENVMFIHQTKWIEPMDHKLWQYYQQMTVDWTCAVDKGQDHIFPFPMDEKYTIIQTKNGKTNGELIHHLEDKWIEFWHKYESLHI